MNFSRTDLFAVADKAVFGMLIGAVVVVYILDAIFFGSKASTIYLVPVFLLFGIVLRTGAVFIPIYLATFKKDNHSARTILRTAWLACIIACVFSAINFFAAGHAAKEASAVTGQSVAQAVVDDSEVRIDRRQDAIDAANARREREIAAARANISELFGDGDGNNDDIVGAESAVAEINNRIDLEIASLRTEITGIENEGRTDEGSAATNLAEADEESTTWPVFTWLGEKAFGEKTWADSVLLYFALALEFIAGFLFGPYAVLRQKFGARLATMQIEDQIVDIDNQRRVQEAQDQADLERERMEVERQQAQQEAQDLAAIRRVQMETEQKQRLQRAQDEADVQAERLEIERLTRLAETRKELEEARRALEEDEEEDDLTPEQRRARKGGHGGGTKRGKIRVGDIDPFENMENAG